MWQPAQAILHHSTSWCLLYTGRGSGRELERRKTQQQARCWSWGQGCFMISVAWLPLNVRLMACLLITDVECHKGQGQEYLLLRRWKTVVTERLNFPSPPVKVICIKHQSFFLHSKKKKLEPCHMKKYDERENFICCLMIQKEKKKSQKKWNTYTR